MSILVVTSSTFKDLETVSDPLLRTYIQEKIKSGQKSLLICPYIHYASIAREEGNTTITAKKIDKGIHTAVKFFEKHPPLENTSSLFSTMVEKPFIAAIKDTQKNRWLDLEETRALCNSLNWVFLDPIKVEDATTFMALSLQGLDTYPRVVCWKDTTEVVKLYSFDIGACLALFIPEEFQKIIKETNQSAIWYWILKQPWSDEFSKMSSTTESYVDKLWSVLK